MALTTNHEPSTINPTLIVFSVPCAEPPFGTAVQILGVLGVLAVKNAHSDDAAAMSEPAAAHVPLQRHAPVFPPVNCVNSTAVTGRPACHCSDYFDNCDIFSLFTILKHLTVQGVL
ncbi:MAG: hypothetical protein R3E39_18800 [Anaerolineae bacterium]